MSADTFRAELFCRGMEAVTKFCELNHIDVPKIVQESGPPMFGVCAYYRRGVIYIWVHACATFGRAGRMWSWPGHSVDRTPFGVLAHELAHHVDKAHGAAGGTYGYRWREETKEKPLTGYCPNDNEWFAEMFRLYVTNPELLAKLRPETFMRMLQQWKAIETRPWREVLAGADRQLEVLRKRIGEPV